MKLAEAYKQVSSSQQGSPCGVRRLLNSLDKADRATLQALLLDPNVRHSDLEETVKLAKLDPHPTASTFSRHRRGACSCPPAEDK